VHSHDHGSVANDPSHDKPVPDPHCIAPLPGLPLDPVCGMPLDTRPPHTSTRRRPRLFSADSIVSTSSLPTRAGTPRASGKLRPLPRRDAGRDLHLPDAPGDRQAGPGNCPKCGMALEPVRTKRRHQPNPELLDMARRFWIGLALTVPVLDLAMAEHLPRLHAALPNPKFSGWIQFILSVPVVLWARGLSSCAAGIR